MTRRWVWLLCVAAAVATAWVGMSCKKRPPPPPPPPPPVEIPRPGEEFSDPELQRRYEESWDRHLELFTPPPTGSLVYVHLNDGSFAGGTVKRWSEDGLLLKDGKLEQDVPRANIAEDSLPDLFLRQFAEKYSMAEIMAPPPAPADTSMAARVRYSLTDFPEPRLGPGPRYRAPDNVDINKGTTLLVLDERNGWLKVRPLNRPAAEPFWVNQFTTVPAPGAPPEDFSKPIAALIASGYLAGFVPAQNEALVPKQAWAGTDEAVREGISRVLAAQCTRINKSTVDWVEIKDVENGRRLARYSQAQGFRSQ